MAEIAPQSSFCEYIEKTNEEKDPDVATHEQKELDECDEMVNYPVYRTYLEDCEVCISTATGKGKERNDAHL